MEYNCGDLFFRIQPGDGGMGVVMQPLHHTIQLGYTAAQCIRPARAVTISRAQWVRAIASVLCPHGQTSCIDH